MRRYRKDQEDLLRVQGGAVAITFGGINTGLPPNLVDQLVEVEKQPIKNLEQKKQKTQNKLNLVNQLDEKVQAITKTLGQLASTRGFSNLKVVSGDPTILDGTADPELAPNGNWNIEVMQLANKAAALSNGFPDDDKTQLGVGYFKFKTPNGTKEVYIDGASSTLKGAAQKINQAGLGFQASVIKDSKDKDNPYRLMVSGMKVGEDNSIEYPTLYFLDGDQDFYFDEEKPAQNGKIKLDGFELEVDSNKLNNIVPGLTLDLKQAAPGRTISIGVSEDREVVSGKIKDFVEKANDVLSFIQKQNQLNEKSDTSQTLGGDAVLRTVENNLRQMIQGAQYTGSKVTSLNQLGITFNRNGTIDLDQEKFNKVLAESPADVRQFLVGDGFKTGFIPGVKNTIARISNLTFGAIGLKKQGLQQQISQMDQRIDNMTRMVEQKEKTLRQRFANLEETMSKLKSQGNVLNEKLGGPSAGALNFGGASLGSGI